MLMATPMSLAYSFFLVICSINILSSYSANVTTPVKPRGVAIKLIHRNSVQSPYYNPNATISELAEQAIKSSVARVRFLTKRVATTPNGGSPRAGLIGDTNGFLANISIGTPPVPQLVHIDTASDLFWIQCLPCISCSGQFSPVFDPAKSSTYSNIDCGSIWCRETSYTCDKDKKNCTYVISYLDFSYSEGNLASDQATFETSNKSTIQVPIEVLGCGHQNNLGQEVKESGVLGLGPNSPFPSLARQFGSKFSYCIGDITDPQYQFNQLILGDGAIMQGSSATLEPFEGAYYLNLEGISIGSKSLKIDPGVFKRKPSGGGGGVFIDSGATMTMLTKEAYGPFEDEVKSLMAGRKNVSDPDFLCYEGSVKTDLSSFPLVIFQFDGAQLVIESKGMFFQYLEDVMCMAVKSDRVTVVGVMAQQNNNIGYDVEQGKIYFQKTHCELLGSLT